jgi:hypothetical protein
MARMTAQLFRELLESLDDDIETLGMEQVMTEGEDVPDATECAAIARVKQNLQGFESPPDYNIAPRHLPANHQSRCRDRGANARPDALGIDSSQSCRPRQFQDLHDKQRASGDDTRKTNLERTISALTLSHFD